MKRSNCLAFAIGRWLRNRGYIIVRKSNYGWWPHFIWSSDLRTFEEFEPLAEKQSRWFPPLFFYGYVRIFVMDADG